MTTTTPPALATLFSPFALGALSLANRVVMAPMTRSRAGAGGVPTALMATYYGARAAAGLIVTEGVAPVPDGLGYARIPGLWSPAQVDAWKPVTAAVHAAGGTIFAQLMHAGRIGHPLNLPEGARLVGPSAIAAPGEMWTDQQQLQPHPVPAEMSEDDIRAAIEGFAQAARNAREAGFDGVEIHGANGYLVDQFLNPAANQRADAWGGSPEARGNFAFAVAEAVAAAIGADRTGIRLSPYGAFNGMAVHDALDATFEALAARLGTLKLAYVHLVDHASMGAPEVPQATKDRIRAAFGGPIVLSGGYDAARAEQDLAAGKGELVAFGRPFIANPDLVAKLQAGAPLRDADPTTFYTPGEQGYTDYPLG